MSTNKILIIPGALVSLTAFSGLLLSSTITKADGNASSTDVISITVDSACTMTGGPTGESTTDNTYSATIDPGTYDEISGSKLVTVCNDALGYSIYAIGYSGDSYDSNTHTDLIGANSIENIQTGTSGSNSYWAMKLEAVTGVTPPTILNSFDNYHVIPDTYTQIAKQETATTSPSDAGASVQTKYKVNISSSQTAGIYTGKVKYTMVHPNTAPAPTPQAPGIYTLSRSDAGESQTRIGQPIPNDVETYNTLADVLTAWEEKYYQNSCQFFLKHIVLNGIITESYVGFVITPEDAALNEGMIVGEYAVRGGVDESALQDKPIFNANVNTIKAAFGFNSHPERCMVEDSSIYCSGGSVDISVDDNGYASSSNGMHCNIFDDGVSSCEYQ